MKSAVRALFLCGALIVLPDCSRTRDEAAEGAIHRLRHTFCSMLAAEVAPPLANQELAGHSHISTTMKYMHLSPTTRGAAIALLE